MKKIELTQGRVAIVDDDDFEKLLGYKCLLLKSRGYTKDYVYFYSKDLKKAVLLHRFIMNPPGGMVVDHKNGDTLDNRKKNLRICTNQENSRNRSGLQKNNTSGYQGVTKRHGGWESRIEINGKSTYLGFSKDKVLMARLYDEMAKKYHGEFATLNFK